MLCFDFCSFILLFVFNVTQKFRLDLNKIFRVDILWADWATLAGWMCQWIDSPSSVYTDTVWVRATKFGTINHLGEFVGSDRPARGRVVWCKFCIPHYILSCRFSVKLCQIWHGITDIGEGKFSRSSDERTPTYGTWVGSFKCWRRFASRSPTLLIAAYAVLIRGSRGPRTPPIQKSGVPVAPVKFSSVILMHSHVKRLSNISDLKLFHVWNDRSVVWPPPLSPVLAFPEPPWVPSSAICRCPSTDCTTSSSQHL